VFAVGHRRAAPLHTHARGAAGHRHVPGHCRRARGARAALPLRREGGGRALHLRPARRAPVRHRRPARLRRRDGGRPLSGHGLPHSRRDGGHLEPAAEAARRHLVRRRRRVPGGDDVHQRPRLRADGRPRPARAEPRAHRLRSRRVARRPHPPDVPGHRRPPGVQPHDECALGAHVRVPVGRDDRRWPAVHATPGQPARQRRGERRQERARVHGRGHAPRHGAPRLGRRGRGERPRDDRQGGRAGLRLPRPAGSGR